MIIDPTQIDQNEFHVRERGNVVLVTPKKTKHLWTRDEYHLRSLLLEKGTGWVLSAGWPKFFNWGEKADEDDECAAAFSRGAVEVSRKMDGTCILLDWKDGKAHFRTRGNFDLGDFREPVEGIILAKYPTLLQDWSEAGFLLNQGFMERTTFCFEYVSPDNRIVLEYNEPQLSLLGYVNKDNILPGWDSFTMSCISDATGVPVVEVENLKGRRDAASVARTIAARTGEEGVVLRYVASRSPYHAIPRMMKMKTDEYFRLHALKFSLEGRVGKLCYLLDITDVDEGRQRLMEFGVDFETTHCVAAEMADYVSSLAVVTAMYEGIRDDIAGYRAFAELRGDTEPQEVRKQFVRKVQAEFADDPHGRTWFSVSMKLFDGKDALDQAIAEIVLGESYQTVRQWGEDKRGTAEAMLRKVPVEAD